ncbi:MAG: histidine kinase [Lewinellaceae bacterium]|nr:histidine kinase [Lewinellaceae bacterium]
MGHGYFFEKTFLGFSFLFYILFIYQLLHHLHSCIFIYLKNYKINAIKLILVTTIAMVVFAGISQRLFHSQFFTELIIIIGSSINSFLYLYASYWLIRHKNRIVRLIGYSMLILCTGLTIGLFLYYVDKMSNLKINPFIVSEIFFLIELTILNYIIYFISAEEKKKLSFANYEMEKEIQNARQEALNAQMNPHFIFNCLNSVQNYIMTNEKFTAMNYLSMFAKLIRLFLEASNEDKISLENEITLLTNYCELEKMRTPDKFQFFITNSPEMDLQNIFIPPFLIQPFVENAIIHGMKGKKNREGIIKVHFENEINNLRITILDNGGGFQSTYEKKETKSFGMELTKKRLKLIYDNFGKSYGLNINSNVDGTLISINVPM